ncbi:MAG: LysR family transcriptional regulator [Proteobacteria bacterium]|nr:LysR family transcriptional regulator [Pseudomonadota bacterium]
MNYLRIFVKVVETRSYTSTANFFGIPKSRVSRAVSQMEEALQTSLIYRTTRQVEPTTAGLQLFVNCRESMERIQNGLREASDQSKQMEGSIRITAVEDIGVDLVAPLVAKFSERYPRLRIEMLLDTKVLDLVKNSIDLAVRVGKVAQVSHHVRKIGRIYFILVASPKYLARFSTPPSINDLENVEFIALSGLNLRKKGLVLCNGPASRVVKVNAKLEATSTAAIRQLAIAGRGVALLPNFMCADFFKKELLIPVCRDWHALTKPVCIVTPTRHKKTSAARMLSDFLCHQLAEKFI